MVVVVRGFFSFLLDVISPELCTGCGAELPDVDAGALPPRLDGWPLSAADFFVRGMGRTLLCRECWMRLEPSFGSSGRLLIPRLGRDIGVVTPFFTNGTLLSLVKHLKFSGGTKAAGPLSWWMARALVQAMGERAGGALLVPVPLHWSRARGRGYNQGALLARGVARELGARIDEKALIRTRRTRRQANLRDAARGANVRGAFRCGESAGICGEMIVLVDDLFTSGETARWCIEPLLEAGASGVVALALGRRRSENRRCHRHGRLSP